MKKFKTFILAAIAILSCFFAVSCEKPDAASTQISRQLTDSTILVGLHETFTGTNFSLRYDSLLEDSRCPEGVQCCWAGNARVKLTLTQNGVNYTFTLNTFGGFPDMMRDTIINNARYELIEVAPYPKITESGIFYDGDFSATIKMTYREATIFSNSYWNIDEYLGLYENAETYKLYKTMPNIENRGVFVRFDNDGNFYCSNTSMGENDCFISLGGTYEAINNSQIHFIVNYNSFSSYCQETAPALTHNTLIYNIEQNADTVILRK